jgi:GNAT superfamily N-acetyltransferase
MVAYRFCRPDDIPLLVDAVNRCYGAHFPSAAPFTVDALRREMREVQLWPSNSMIASGGDGPVAVVLGTKRPREVLVRRIGVAPGHQRTGHGRHLLGSLSQKLAVLGPPRLVAEVPGKLAEARAFFAGAGWSEEVELVDYERPAAPGGTRRAVRACTVEDLEATGAFSTVTMADLEAAGVLAATTAWERQPEALRALADLRGLALCGAERFEAWTLYRVRAGGRNRPARTRLQRARARAGATLALLCARLQRLHGGLLRLRWVAPGELSPAFLAELGFRGDGDHGALRHGGRRRHEALCGHPRRRGLRRRRPGGRAARGDGSVRSPACEHLVAVASGKGGVGKSTVTLALARALRRGGAACGRCSTPTSTGPVRRRWRGWRVRRGYPASTASRYRGERMGWVWCRWAACCPPGEALRFSTVSQGDEQVWRGTREMTFLAQVLRSVRWGALDFLLVDLPPGAERTAQLAGLLGARAGFVLVTIPSAVARRVVARSIDALERSRLPGARLRREHGRVCLPWLRAAAAAVSRRRAATSAVPRQDSVRPRARGAVRPRLAGRRGRWFAGRGGGARHAARSLLLTLEGSR